VTGSTAALLLGIAILATGCGTQPLPSPTAPATVPPSMTPPATVPPTPSVSATGAVIEGWSSVAGQSAVEDVQFQDVVWTGARFVATGVELGGGGVFLDSTDGLAWHRQALTSATALPARLAAGPLGVVAIGRIDDRPAIWVSPDGLAWTSRSDALPASATGTDSIEVMAVTATDTGWLAVGREDPYCQVNCGLAPVRAIAWTSGDGLRWTRASDQDALRGAAMTAVTRGGPGFVAVGLLGINAAAWTSTDGRSWTRVPDSPLFHELPSDDPSLWTTMTAVAAGHAIVVAVGNEGPGGGHGPAARAWWSADGLAWRPAEGEDFQSGGEVSVIPTSVISTPDGFLMTASTNGGCTGGIWTSTDGRAWQCVARGPAFAGFRGNGVAASSSVEVVVGLTSVADPSSAGLPGGAWRRVLP
jgi:hypothetical protein